MGIRHKFVYDGVPSAEFGLWILGKGTYSAPKRRIESEQIPGRNGALTIDYGSYENAEVRYSSCAITENLDTNIDAFREFLLSHVGYYRLEDSYRPDEYRMARISKAFEPTVTTRRNAATFDLTFDCMPQRFLKSGEQAVTLTASGALYNRTTHDALPLITVYGTGVLGIGDSTITVNDNTDFGTVIDSELNECLNNGTNWSGKVDMTDKTYPVLSPGKNGISLGNGITRVSIRPRWYVL